jgi:hypothetical protein
MQELSGVSICRSSKVSVFVLSGVSICRSYAGAVRCQYLYFGTINASKLSTCSTHSSSSGVSDCSVVLVKQVKRVPAAP